jgi:hypothetical protein
VGFRVFKTSRNDGSPTAMPRLLAMDWPYIYCILPTEELVCHQVMDQGTNRETEPMKQASNQHDG